MSDVSAWYVKDWQLVYCYGHGGYFWRPWSHKPTWNRNKGCLHPPIERLSRALSSSFLGDQNDEREVPMRQPWRRCITCRGVCYWVEDAWVCDNCGDEWYPDELGRDHQYDPPIFSIETSDDATL